MFPSLVGKNGAVGGHERLPAMIDGTNLLNGGGNREGHAVSFRHHTETVMSVTMHVTSLIRAYPPKPCAA